MPPQLLGFRRGRCQNASYYRSTGELRLKRAFSIAVLTAALVAGASVAEAKVASGTFKGKTEAEDPVAFKVTSKGRIQSFYFETVHLKCTDGDEFDTFSGPGKRIETPKKTTF